MLSFEIISIPVSDQQASKAFYQKMGFKVIVEAPYEHGQKWIQMAIPGSSISITLVTWFNNMPPGCINGLVIKTDTLEQDIAAMRAQGIDVAEPENTPWGIFASVKDPDGNRLSLPQ
jgi:predicted enzyme related to lactoylglutathione lyase